MKKITNSILIVTPLLLVFLLSATIVFAWFVFMKTKPLASFESGQIVVNVEINDDSITETINISDLAFMDFGSDIISDDDAILNKMASVHLIKINNSATSSDVKNVISFSNVSEGIFYLLYLEGTNLSPELIGLDVDWHNLIFTTIGSETLASAQRTLLTNYNNNIITSIASLQLEPGEWINLQIAVWGDYDMLIDQTNYLMNSYSMDIAVATTQWEGAI